MGALSAEMGPCTYERSGELQENGDRARIHIMYKNNNEVRSARGASAESGTQPVPDPSNL